MTDSAPGCPVLKQKDGSSLSKAYQGILFYTYMVQCRDGSFYTGYTPRLQQRILAHQNGSGARYTRARRPVTLVYFEIHLSRHDAMRREAQIKKSDRRNKLALVRSMDPFCLAASGLLF